MMAGKRNFYVSAMADEPLYAGDYWRKPGDMGFAATDHLDVIFTGDWRAHVPSAEEMQSKIHDTIVQGKSVGLLHFSDLLKSEKKRLPLADWVMKSLEREDIRFVHHDQPVRTDLLFINDPSWLQFASTTQLAIEPAEVLIVDRRHGNTSIGEEALYSRIDIEANAKRLFGKVPTWVDHFRSFGRVGRFDDTGLKFEENCGSELLTDDFKADAGTFAKPSQRDGRRSIARPNPWDIGELIEREGDIVAISVPVRKPADAELCDSLTVVFEKGKIRNPQLLATVIAGNLPRGQDLKKGTRLPEGVLALALSSDNRWSFTICGDWTAEVEASGRAILHSIDNSA